MATPISEVISKFGGVNVAQLRISKVETVKYTAVGFKGCKNFLYNRKVLSTLQNYYENENQRDKKITVKSVEIPTKEEYFTWLNLRHNAEQVSLVVKKEPTAKTTPRFHLTTYHHQLTSKPLTELEVSLVVLMS